MAFNQPMMPPPMAPQPMGNGLAPPPAGPAPVPPPMPPNQALLHGRAISGAKALHALGHISEAQKDKHVNKSMKALGKKAPPVQRKPFGSFAPAVEGR